MKTIDNNGYVLCDIQSQLFEQSLSLNCSTEIFIRRFMNSKIAKQFDSTQILDDTLSVDSMIQCLNDEYGVSHYGLIKYSKNELYWIGHIYRYFCYTYEISSRQAYKIVKPKELRTLYESYHTLGTAQAIERILEAKKIHVYSDDYTEKGLEILRRMKNNIITHKMNLWNDSFEAIKSGTKTIEMRLNDEKRNAIKENDVIVFTNTSTNESLSTKVVHLYQYENFEELYSHHDKISIGYKKDETANPKDMLLYYSHDDICKYGVLGIEIKLISR